MIQTMIVKNYKILKQSSQRLFYSKPCKYILTRQEQSCMCDFSQDSII